VRFGALALIAPEAGKACRSGWLAARGRVRSSTQPATEVLQQAGYTVPTAKDGVDALLR
jgi:hypothetical protein